MNHDLYTKYADWWPLVSSPADYAEDAAFYADIMRKACSHEPKTILEFGCGGGNNASHLKQHFEMTLTDLAPEILEVSRLINPQCEHVQGDMRDMRLNREFDIVFIHDAVMYMTDLEDLGRCLETSYLHCKPGGAALFVPDYTRESFVSCSYDGGGSDEQREMRYLEWDMDPDPSDSTYEVRFMYAFKHPDNRVTMENEIHLCGLFSRDEWTDAIAAAGFTPQVVTLESEEFIEGSYQVFAGTKPGE